MNDNTYTLGQRITVQPVDKPGYTIPGIVVGVVVRFLKPYTEHHNIPWLDSGASTYTHGVIGERPTESILVQKLKTD